MTRQRIIEQSKNAQESGDPQANAIKQTGFEQKLCRAADATDPRIGIPINL
jgi:hypothetical protein